MKNSFSQLFYIKKGKIDNKQKTIIYLRITVNGRRAGYNKIEFINKEINQWKSVLEFKYTD